MDRWLFAYPDDTEYPKLNHEQLPKEITKSWSDIIETIFKLPHKPETKHFRLTKDAMALKESANRNYDYICKTNNKLILL